MIKQNRFNVPVLLLRKAIEEKKFGKLILGTVRVRWSRNQSYYDQAPWRGTWKMDGGVLMNQACHHVDMLNWMMGDVDTVFADPPQRSPNVTHAPIVGTFVFDVSPSEIVPVAANVNVVTFKFPEAFVLKNPEFLVACPSVIAFVSLIKAL